MPQRLRLTALIAVVFALVAVPSAFARGGSGGGGSTTDYGAIDRVSDVPTCDAGSFVSVVLDKGANKQIEGTITMLGGTNADGTSTLYGGWSMMLKNETTGASVGGLGTSFESYMTSVRITNLFSGVPVGQWELSLTFTKRPYGFLVGSDAPVLETCVAHFFVNAR